MEISNFTPELAAAAAPITQAAPQAQPVLPVPSAIPQQPDQQAQPDQSPTQAAPISTAPAASVAPATPGFADRLHDHVNAVAAKMPPVPGSFARSLVAGALAALRSAPHIISGIEDSLSDSSEAAKGALPGEGVLASVGRIRAAETNRKQAAQVAQTAEDRERAAIAFTSVQTLHQQALLHAASDAANHEDIANGRAFIKLYTEDQSALVLLCHKIGTSPIFIGQDSISG